MTLEANLKKRPTLKTIAYMSGLGVTTVCRALQDAPDISAKTKERVRSIAEQIKYQPNGAALRLRTGKTNVISFIMNTEEEGLTEYFSQFIIGVSQALENSPYNLTMAPYSKEKDPLERIRQVVENRLADGLILTCVEPKDRRVEYLHEKGFPFATHGRSNMDIDHAYFDFDNEAFGENAVRLLAKLRRSNVGVVMPSQHLTYCNDFKDGYQSGLRETGLKNHVVISPAENDSLEQIAEQVFESLQKPKKADAFVCTRFTHTMGVMSAIKRAGLELGKDIDVVTKQSSSNFLKWMGEPIYSFNEDFVAAGSVLANSLVKLIDGADAKDHQTVVHPESWGVKVTD